MSANTDRPTIKWTVETNFLRTPCYTQTVHGITENFCNVAVFVIAYIQYSGTPWILNVGLHAKAKWKHAKNISGPHWLVFLPVHHFYDNCISVFVFLVKVAAHYCSASIQVPVLVLCKRPYKTLKSTSIKNVVTHSFWISMQHSARSIFSLNSMVPPITKCPNLRVCWYYRRWKKMSICFCPLHFIFHLVASFGFQFDSNSTFCQQDRNTYLVVVVSPKSHICQCV